MEFFFKGLDLKKLNVTTAQHVQRSCVCGKEMHACVKLNCQLHHERTNVKDSQLVCYKCCTGHLIT